MSANPYAALDPLSVAAGGRWIELRSDTYTKPTPAMREAMAKAEVGDDMVGEDPTVNELEARVADLLGMEAAVFNCSGTQSNQMAVAAHCQRGDELLIESTGHIANYEAGGAAVLSGVTCTRIAGDAGRLDVEQLRGSVRPDNIHFTPTRLLCLENSTNHGGGRTYPLDQLARVCGWAREQGLKTHLDGARLFNACLARDYQPRDVAKWFDSVSICFSKGLGCPMGSILVGRRDDMQRARRARKLFGGALRQAGIPAAGCLYALEHHVERLREDHRHAQLLAHGLAEIPGLKLDVASVETNLVFFEVDAAIATAAELSLRLAQSGVRLNPSGGPQRLRACTHLDVNADQIHDALAIIRDAVVELADR